jgi:hypothetical protein
MEFCELRLYGVLGSPHQTSPQTPRPIEGLRAHLALLTSFYGDRSTLFKRNMA